MLSCTPDADKAMSHAPFCVCGSTASTRLLKSVCTSGVVEMQPQRLLQLVLDYLAETGHDDPAARCGSRLARLVWLLTLLRWWGGGLLLAGEAVCDRTQSLGGELPANHVAASHVLHPRQVTHDDGILELLVNVRQSVHVLAPVKPRS